MEVSENSGANKADEKESETKEEIENLFMKIGASELQISTFQSKEQVL